MDFRNFAIIAHIDHGKSTLADRMIELTHTVQDRKMKDQLLDSMDLERERGITIKLQPVRMMWRGKVLNLIDTPGHVDFQYEVARSLQAVEGAVLLVDATQGVQAQTLANLYAALEQDLEIIPVINKIDLPVADVEGTEEELVELLGVKPEEILKISAKTGAGVEAVLDALSERVPAAGRAEEQGLRALIFDSVYDEFKGVVAYVRIVEGAVSRDQKIEFLGTGASDKVLEVGVFTPAYTKKDKISAGEIGYVATGLKDIRGARVGDTIASAKGGILPLPGFKIPQPKVFAGIYPVSNDQFVRLREAVHKLQLNDASLTVLQERNEALGQGFRCGLLGILHLDIVSERLKREYDVDAIITSPSVRYRVELKDGRKKEVYTPADFPSLEVVEGIDEQFVTCEVIVPQKYMGEVFQLFKRHEAVFIKREVLGQDRLLLSFDLPLRELVVDTYDELKSVTSGYGSLSYELGDWRQTEVVKLSILVNKAPVEALSTVVPRNRAEEAGRKIVDKLKDVMPRQLFALPLQAAVGGRIVARETVPAMRKDVTGHLYGGDVTRKKKLLEKQKKGKKRLAEGAAVRLPPEVYISLMKR